MRLKEYVEIVNASTYQMGNYAILSTYKDTNIS
jgi:hypothetical protein